MRTATERKDNPACTGRAEARRGRVLRRSVQHRDVKGVLACRNGRWTVDNESEVRMLSALGADGDDALDRFQALAETLNAGLVDPSGLRRFNGRLTEMAAAPEAEVAIEWHDASSALRPDRYVLGLSSPRCLRSAERSASRRPRRWAKGVSPVLTAASMTLSAK